MTWAPVIFSALYMAIYRYGGRLFFGRTPRQAHYRAVARYGRRVPYYYIHDPRDYQRYLAEVAQHAALARARAPPARRDRVVFRGSPAWRARRYQWEADSDGSYYRVRRSFLLP